MQSIGGCHPANDPVHIPRNRPAARFRGADAAAAAVTNDTFSMRRWSRPASEQLRQFAGRQRVGSPAAAPSVRGSSSA